ncbi:hypothetical protein ACFQO9_11320 [Chryseobacterium zhengzhouense]|uniref:Uncharacterized protein n=1 Tax=Chryseobacterium zhengzhouense TaxID=1636086 RepID=A0ABW2LYM4_9FLAO
MATKNQQKAQETQAPETVTEKNELPVVNENPYSQKVEENKTDAFNHVEMQHEVIPQNNADAFVHPEVEKTQETQAPETVTEPIKPTLTDNVISSSASAVSNKIQNKFGVVVGISGMAAKLLQNMDKNTKFVK